MIVTLRCGNRTVAIGDVLKLDQEIGLSMIGGNDLFDLGFRIKELQRHGLFLYVDEQLIAELARPEKL